MTTINRPRHRATVRPEPCDPVYRALTPRVAQRIITALVILSTALVIIDSHPAGDRLIALGASLVLWAGHGWIITHRRGANHAG